MKIAVWNIEALTGYKPITTFYEDFSIADHFGLAAVKDTYNRGLETAKFMGYKYLTEFVMVLNWKGMEHYEKNTDLSKLYYDLWMEADIYAQEHMSKEELRYFYRTTD